MAREQFDIAVQRGNGGWPRTVATDESVGELLKRLTADAGELIRHEMSLAKAELRETSITLARDGMKIGVALGLALAGVLSLTAFLIVALGDLFENYWLSALAVGVLFLAVGGFLVKNAMTDIRRRGVKPEQTMENVREDAAWAKREAREFKRELTT